MDNITVYGDVENRRRILCDMPILHVQDSSGSPSTVDKKTCVRVGLGIGSGNSLMVDETCARAPVRRSIKIIIIIT